MRKIIIFTIVGLLVVITFFPIINGLQNYDDPVLMQISETQDKLLINDKIIGDMYVKYWVHVINDVVIKNDYILLQENTKDNSIIKFEKKWTNIQDLGLNLKQIDLNIINIDKDLVAWREKVLFPEKNDLKIFYSVNDDQLFPLLCWEVRYINGNTILYDDEGVTIGEGIQAPYDGFSMSGYNDASWPDPWLDYRLSADNWFKKWCDSTTSISLPTVNDISSYVVILNIIFFLNLLMVIQLVFKQVALVSIIVLLM